ncbi:hypothetical protein JW926_15230 [Candidatus Sumerlaeota bacterium]|nr:hypothetical protein [Candidatus Sumerlaeota bacterium]
MSKQVWFKVENPKEIRFKRITPAVFDIAINAFLKKLPSQMDQRAKTILHTLKRKDNDMVKAIFSLGAIEEKEFKTYQLREGNLVLAAMTRRILSQEYVNAKGMERVVDDDDFRKAIDMKNLSERVSNFGFYMRETWKLKNREIRAIIEKLDLSGIKRIVMPGAMGGSAIGGLVVKMLLSNLGFQSDLDLLPHYPSPMRPLRKGDLALIYSYSGNTEEALLWMEKLNTKDVKIIGVSTGGRLEEICSEQKLPFIRIPGKKFNLVQPREHLAVAIVILLAIVGYAGMAWREERGKRLIFDIEKWWSEIERSTQKLTELARKKYNVGMPFSQSPAKQAALFLNWGATNPAKVERLFPMKDPAFWASPFYEAIARRLENQFGECVEHPASAKIMPEDMHNEQEAYVQQWFETLWGGNRNGEGKIVSPNTVFLRFKGYLDKRLTIRADKLFNDFLKGAPQMRFEIKNYGKEYPMLGELEALLFCDLTRAFSSIYRGVTPHYVHSMNYNKFYMATVPGGPGIKGGI